MNQKKFYEKIKENSLKEIDLKKTDKKVFVSNKTIALITLIFLSLNLYVCNEAYDNYNTKNKEHYSISANIMDNTINVYEEMQKSGITYSKNLTVDDYKKIKNLKEEDLFSYYNSLGKYECEKVIKALGYENWNDFLNSKNFENINNWASYEKSKIIHNTKMR